MSFYADTSFIASLYLREAHSPAAHLAVQAVATVLPLTPFGEFELNNAVRATVVRRGITVPAAEQALNLIRQDASRGRLLRTPCDMDKIVRVASSLSHQHTYAGGYRALDIVHVAIAVVLGRTAFLTFDQRQAELARPSGLAAQP